MLGAKALKPGSLSIHCLIKFFTGHNAPMGSWAQNVTWQALRTVITQQIKIHNNSHLKEKGQFNGMKTGKPKALCRY